MTAIVDYGAGNLTSVRHAFQALGVETRVAKTADDVRRADRLVFPGVGAAAHAMANLRRAGLEDAIREAARTKPFLGICLGMQILFSFSEEDGGTPLLGVFDGRVRHLPVVPGFKIPEIGWNGAYYFVHSYAADLVPETCLKATYAGVDFTACVKKGRLWASQFHPEKSGRLGLDFLRAWLESPDRFPAGLPASDALSHRLIPCLDVRNGRVTKGVKFKNNVDLGDPVEMALRYAQGGADELVFYDITASAERRPIDIEMVRRVARDVRIPFAVGGGLSTLADMERVILAGAEKVSVNSLAVRNPAMISEGAKVFGSQCIVVGMDPVRSPRVASGYEITTHGFREWTGLDAVEWARRVEGLGAGEIVVNSVDADGTREGFEVDLTKRIADAVSIPVVASGGAGKPEHFASVFREAKADAAILAGMIHSGEWTIREVKEALAREKIPVRLDF